MRAVLDANVLVSAALSASGAPAELLRRAGSGEFELVVSDALLAELARALADPRVRKRLGPDDASAFVDVVRRRATHAPDPPPAAIRSPDPDDDYLVALAIGENALLVTGDAHLLGLGERLPILKARTFLDRLDADA